MAMDRHVQDRTAHDGATPEPSGGASTWRTQMKRAIQGADGFAAQSAALSPDGVHAAAREGVSGGGGALPHLDAIQQSFGRHDVSGVSAHVGGKVADASRAMGAEAYATGDSVAFAGTPSLHTAAHEAAHVVQQRAGVSLLGGVGRSGDDYERHADAVADAVVAGRSAEVLLDAKAGGAGAQSAPVQRAAVQRKTVQGGPELKVVQEKLNNLSYDAGTVDGIWGPRTRGAVVSFQGDQGIAADGIVGPMTLGKLDSAGGGGGAGAKAAGADKRGDEPGAKKDEAAAGTKTTKEKTKPAKTESKAKAGAADNTPEPVAGEPPAPAAPPLSGGRAGAVAAAEGMVGKVKAKELSGKDQEGKAARFGWEHLTDFFNVAYGNWPDPELLKRPRAGKVYVGKDADTGEAKYDQRSDVLPSWCGIFAVWAVKQGGFSVGNWGPGKAGPNIMKQRAKYPQPGDIVVKPAHNHHALVVWVEPDAAKKAAEGKTNSIIIKTVDGNSGSNPYSGGEVVAKGTSTMGDWVWGAWSPE